ncbi:RNA polymerase sigma factor [Pedobacter heparinus]|uniref:RNA polymerase sigma factor, sigma-70 family n=1 Tax=Pedobacter heparinus (strain ATCC 13125 / DSM 2366 / CIP 104194 / JCM 7457 / NBRC 12017 / NCIMB 9290 / NRRL B-14731 / HIM 762-3) TaxID=485917 RepID=C6XWB5_PEDHD|nr:sigma-70 family RNA polymerase sigma factor [Pedobacter heparinus]ACU04194.1 RNA polymerase sigma factor, sigma-70 family [Pedobacter heparinus DSM 2366]
MADYSKYSDEELFGLLKQDDQKAYLEIYDRYKVLLQNHAIRKLTDMDDVEDILQELFIDLWDKRAAIYLTTGLVNYLYTAMRNRIFNHFYKKQREGNYLNSLVAVIERGEYVTDLALREKEYTEIIKAEIDALPERMREVFLLHRNEGLTYKEIAEQLGTSELTVATQVKKSLKTLRLRLGATGFSMFI